MAIRAIFLLLCVSLIHAKVWQLNCDTIRRFVDGHNSRRLEIASGQVDDQPAASKMYSMVWDEELARKAAKWASHNMFQHNPDRTIPSGRFGTGENIYYYSTTDRNFNFDVDEALESWFSEHKDYTYKPMCIEDFTGPQVGHYTQRLDVALESWFSEHKDYTYKPMCIEDFTGPQVGHYTQVKHKDYTYKPMCIEDFTGPQVGHYTQMVWSDSTYVGCAVSQYPDGGFTTYLVVCNYGPAGNMLGQEAYESGDPAYNLDCGTSDRDCTRQYGERC
ncbi:cysteine-rich secretory protein family domain-containing protein [Phthorimaea operculella]|nr:cysteine-rich secretory protein family domain-containing protein [Phthorimaea operculella]